MKANAIAITIAIICSLSYTDRTDRVFAADRTDGSNERCQSAPNAPEGWEVRQTFNFTDRGKSYRLVHSGTLDGGGSLCLLSGKTAKPVGYKPDWYLD